jgi:ABC-type proline/glycine betaine transport system substrate-binding protein
MKKMLKASALALVAVLALGTMASAAEMSGKVQAVDPAGKSITLDNGTTLMIPATAKVDKKALMPGADVKVSFDEKSGQKIVTSLQVAK